MNSFEMTFTAEDGDIDELNHVNNAVWVQWVQTISTTHWFTVANPIHVDRYFWMLIRHEIDYAGNIGPGDTAYAKTFITEPPRGARFDRNVEFHDAGGKLVVKSKSTWAIIDRETGRIVRVPYEVAAPFLS